MITWIYSYRKHLYNQYAWSTLTLLFVSKVLQYRTKLGAGFKRFLGDNLLPRLIKTRQDERRKDRIQRKKKLPNNDFWRCQNYYEERENMNKAIII